MSLKVVDLNAPNTAWERQVQDDIVSTLEKWVLAAKAGTYDAIAICSVLKDGGVDTDIPAHGQHGVLVGAIATLQHWTIDAAPALPLEPKTR